MTVSTTPPAAANPPAPVTASPIEQVRSWIDSGSDWLTLHGVEITLAATAAAVIYFVLRLARRWVRGRARAHPEAQGAVATALHTLSRTGHFFLLMVSVRLVVGYANPPALLDQTIKFLFIVAAAFQVAVWAKEVVMSLIRQRAAGDRSDMLKNALSIINVLVSIGVFSLAAIVVLDNLGVNVTALIAGLGIGGIAIGFAAKGIFEDLFAALAIIFDRPFRNGDSIKFDTTNAQVERVGLKSTRLRAVTGEQVVISNTNLLSKEIANFARVQRRRMMLSFGVACETPVAVLRGIPALVQGVVEANDCVFVRCGMIAFGASSYDYEAQFDVESDDYTVVFNARHNVALAIIERFAAEGIVIPYPAQTAFTAAPDGTLVMPYAEAQPDRA